MTMLGAIVATFAWFLWESGLIRKRDKGAPVPQVDPGVDVPARPLPGGASGAGRSTRCAAPARSAIERRGEA